MVARFNVRLEIITFTDKFPVLELEDVVAAVQGDDNALSHNLAVVVLVGASSHEGCALEDGGRENIAPLLAVLKVDERPHFLERAVLCNIEVRIVAVDSERLAVLAMDNGLFLLSVCMVLLYRRTARDVEKT